jgi:hypothetical protein
MPCNSRRASVVALTLAAALLCGCATEGGGTRRHKTQQGAAPHNVATLRITKIYSLGGAPDDAAVERFTSKVDSCYSASTPARMTYSITPNGAINPFSDTEVTCISEEKTPDACTSFLGCIEKFYPAVAR